MAELIAAVPGRVERRRILLNAAAPRVLRGLPVYRLNVAGRLEISFEAAVLRLHRVRSGKACTGHVLGIRAQIVVVAWLVSAIIARMERLLLLLLIHVLPPGPKVFIE